MTAEPEYAAECPMNMINAFIFYYSQQPAQSSGWTYFRFLIRVYCGRLCFILVTVFQKLFAYFLGYFPKSTSKGIKQRRKKMLHFLYIQMERSDIRLLSSLRDLRLHSKCEMVLTEERKRKQKRLCPIKVRPEDQEIYQNFKIVHKKKNLLDISFIIKSLGQHFTFAALITDRGLQDRLVEEFRLCKVQQGEYLMKQNDNASSFFILKEGELEVEVNGVTEGKINNGDGFGELALLYSTPRSASILAKKTSELWFIDRSTFRSCVSRIIEKTLAENKKFVSQNKFFAYLTEKQKLKISSIAITQKYDSGSKVCRQGEFGSAMYIIKKGRLTRSIEGIAIGSYESGDSLEEYVTLNKNLRRKETITADGPTELIAFGADEIEKVLGKSLPIIILRNAAKSAIMQDKNLKLLSKEFIDKVIDCFKIEKVAEGETVFNAEDLCKNKIFFFIEGNYEISQNGAKSSIFGTKALSSKSKKESFGFSCKMLSEGKIAVTNLDQIEKGLGLSIDEAIKKSVAIKNIYEGRRSVLTDLQNASRNFELKNFLVVKKLGEGQFGVVFLVIHNETKRAYALKCISKADTIKYKLEKHVINEKAVLESHSSPFTVDFIRSFKDANYIYFLTEFIEGLQLFDALRVIGLVPINLAKFYTASIILAIESLHNKGIIYRDLKPENVMVQSDGYLKIIDMGTCKNLKNSAAQKTFTIIGTPNYMGPEILSGKGYGYSVDLWSLGVVLFEFLSGFLPFGQNCEDPYQIYQEILKNQLKFPKYMKDPSANNLITRLLNKNSEARIGSSFSTLKNHEFFNDIQWHQIIEKKINPTFKPTTDTLIKGISGLKNAKPVQNYLKNAPQSVGKRTDLDPHWDQCF